MVKRFTDTDIWDQDWFIDLDKEYKLLWFYIKDACDHAGIWKPEKKVFELVHRCKVDLKKAEQIFNAGKSRITILENGRWYITGFIPFQYGGKINPNSKVHASALSILEANGVKHSLSIPYLKGSDTLKDKDKDKAKDKDSSKDSEVKVLSARFEQLWVKYPRRLGKKEAARYFSGTVKTEQDWLDIQNALDHYIREIRKDGTSDSYIMHGKTWFNNWRDYVNYGGVSLPSPPRVTPKAKEPEPEMSEEERQEGMKIMRDCLENLGRAKAMPK